MPVALTGVLTKNVPLPHFQGPSKRAELLPLRTIHLLQVEAACSSCDHFPKKQFALESLSQGLLLGEYT